MSKYVEFGEIRKGDNGDYIKVTSYDKVEVLINGVKVNGASIYINPIEEKFERLVSGGYMTQDEADAAIAKIPEYVVERLVLKMDD